MSLLRTAIPGATCTICNTEWYSCTWWCNIDWIAMLWRRWWWSFKSEQWPVACCLMPYIHLFESTAHNQLLRKAKDRRLAWQSKKSVKLSSASCGIAEQNFPCHRSVLSQYILDSRSNNHQATNVRACHFPLSVECESLSQFQLWDPRQKHLPDAKGSFVQYWEIPILLGDFLFPVPFAGDFYGICVLALAIGIPPLFVFRLVLFVALYS